MQEEAHQTDEPRPRVAYPHLKLTSAAEKAMEPPLGAYVTVDRDGKLPVEGVVIARFATHLRADAPRIAVMVPELPCDWEFGSHVFRPRVGDVTLQAFPDQPIEPEKGWAPSSRPDAFDEHIPGTRGVLVGPQHLGDIAKGAVPPPPAQTDTWIINRPWAPQKAERDRAKQAASTTMAASMMASAPGRRGDAASGTAPADATRSKPAQPQQPGLNF